MKKGKRFRAKGKGWVAWVSGPPEPHVPRAWNNPSWTPPSSYEGPPTAVKLMPEYSCEMPLWLCNWWDLDLPHALLNDLADWQEEFDMNFDPEGGWRDTAVRDAWRADADRLRERLKSAVPVGVEVVVDLWPTDEDNEPAR